MKKQKVIKNFSHSDRGAADEESQLRSLTFVRDDDRRSGFTLVELSIVLVIIGLLIGGILVGQSLIESAKMQSFVRQMAQYDALAASFKSKFRALPGDASVFGCVDDVSTPANKCNNGALETTVVTASIYFTAESSLYWKHLSDSGFRPSGLNYTNVLDDGITVKIDENVPKAGIGTAGVAVYGTTAAGNYYLIANYTGNTKINSVQGLTALDSLAFDSKTDDGLADSGNVLVALETPSTNCNTTATYNPNRGSNLDCVLAIRHMSGTNF